MVTATIEIMPGSASAAGLTSPLHVLASFVSDVNDEFNSLDSINFVASDVVNVKVEPVNVTVETVDVVDNDVVELVVAVTVAELVVTVTVAELVVTVTVVVAYNQPGASVWVG